MSNYTKATNFAIKDSLVTTDPSKIIKGTDLDNEFNALSSAIASKADTNSPSLTGTPSAPTATAGSNTTQIANTAFVTAALSLIYPVGSIYINASVSTNPATLLGFGTWAEFGAGRVLVGLDSADTLFDVLEETGGSKDATVVSHTHTATSTVSDPGHAHSLPRVNGMNNSGQGGRYDYQTGTEIYATGKATTGISVATTVASTGSSGTNANVQPFIVVKMWKRTA